MLYLWWCMSTLTLNLLNFLNGIIQLPFLDLSIIIFRDIKMITWSWSANSIQPGQTEWMCRLAWLYTGGKICIFSSNTGLWVKYIWSSGPIYEITPACSIIHITPIFTALRHTEISCNRYIWTIFKIKIKYKYKMSGKPINKSDK